MNLFFKELQLVNTIEGAIKELEKQIDISPKLNEIIDFINLEINYKIKEILNVSITSIYYIYYIR